MAIPGFQELTIEVLKVVGDGEEHRLRDIVDAVADRVGLSDEEQAELLASGQQTVIHNRVSWAAMYLFRAGLLARPRRGIYTITTEGRKVLNDPPDMVDIAYLRRYSGIQEFLAKSTADGGSSGGQQAAATTSEVSPIEAMETAAETIRAELADEILEQIKALSPAFFERLVVELLVKMGYGGSIRDAGRAIGKSGDGGIDGIIKEDRLGLDTIYVQAKRYDSQSIGRPAVQTFAGALQGVRARKGVFLATSTFTEDAQDFASSIDARIILIDGQQLARYMIDHNVGVTVTHAFEIKRIDADFFDEG